MRIHNHVCAVPPLSALAHPRAGAGGTTGPCGPPGPPARGLLYLHGAAMLVEVMECRQEISESRLKLTLRLDVRAPLFLAVRVLIFGRDMTVPPSMTYSHTVNKSMTYSTYIRVVLL